MSFLKSLVREQKILEADVEIEKFITDNEISDDAMVFGLVLDKAVFKSEVEVREYLQDKYFWIGTIADTENAFVVSTQSQAQMQDGTQKDIVIRRGVTAIVGDLQPLVTFEEIQFNEKGEINLSGKFGEIHLSDNMPHIIEIARVAEGEHPAYGKLKITQEHLETMVNNFNSKVTGVDLAVNEDHKKNEAFGWFKDVFLSYDKQTLYGQVAWNTKGTTALSEKQYRYFSPEFRFNYTHPHTGEEHGTTLLGGALTNYPFLKMEAITQLSNKQSNKEIKMSEQTINLADHTKEVVELNTKLNSTTVELNAKTVENISLSEEVKTLKATIELNTKKSAHEKLFTEGHINAAQLTAMNEGKGMLEVIALSAKTTGTPKGGATNDDVIALNENQKSVASTLGLTDEEFNATEL